MPEPSEEASCGVQENSGKKRGIRMAQRLNRLVA